MDHYKLRIKDPSGAEFEAEGPEEFILNEKENFLKDLNRRKADLGSLTAVEPEKADQKAEFWDKVVELKGEVLRLKVKSPQISAAEAALILTAANRAVYQQEETSAMDLSKALKVSGYEPDRLDRLLAKEIREGRATASGTKRNRTYHITQRGLEKAFKAINKSVSQE